MICGKQNDDLPVFGRIKEILVIHDRAMFHVEKYLTTGIDNHLMCHAIAHTHKLCIIHASDAADSYPYSAHTFIGDGHLYIAMRSEVLT